MWRIVDQPHMALPMPALKKIEILIWPFFVEVIFSLSDSTNSDNVNLHHRPSFELVDVVCTLFSPAHTRRKESLPWTEGFSNLILSREKRICLCFACIVTYIPYITSCYAMLDCFDSPPPPSVRR